MTLEEEAFTGFKKEIDNLLPIEESEWDYCRSRMRLETYKKGDFLIRPGESSDVMFYVHSGLVKRYFLTFDGNQVITSFDCENRVITDFPALLRSRPASLFAEWIEDGVCLKSEEGLPSSLKNRNSTWQTIWQKATEMRYFSEWSRVRELLSLSAKDRYLRFEENYADLRDRIPQKDVAFYLGVTPTSLNRIIRGLKT